MAIAGFCRECPISSTTRHVILWMHTLLQINSNNRYVSEPGAPILYLNPKNYLYTETKGFIRRVFWEQSRTLVHSPFREISRFFEKPCWKHWLKYFMRCFIWVLEFFLWALNFFQYFMLQGFTFFTNCAFHMFFSEETNILQLKKKNHGFIFSLKNIKPKHAETLEKIKPKNTE